MRACGSACGLARAGLQAHYLGPPRVFSAGLRAGLTSQTLIAIPT